MRRACALCLFLGLLPASASLLLGSFNVRAFGAKKASNSTLMDVISTVVRRYDVILIQEVRDSDLTATQKLIERVNKDSPFRYRHIVSEPLGRNTYKERYLFLYREQTVSVVQSYAYDDGCESCGTDAFSREPLVVLFSSADSAVETFALVPQHTAPGDAVREVDALHDVAADVRARWGTDNIVLLGDFNAGCAYIKASDWPSIRLFTDKTFHWLIPDDADTTVGDTTCPYDRIVATAEMMEDVQRGSAQVYNYMTELNLSHSLALDVSDHFPVEVELT